jgi:post-segregation antitoxin (ccd killing protein)
MSVRVCVRIPRRLRDEAKRYGISISEVARRALEEEVRRRRRLEEAAAAARRLGELFSRISVEEMVGWLREARRGR